MTDTPAGVVTATIHLKYDVTGVGSTEAEALRLLRAAAVRFLAGYGETLRSDWRDYYDPEIAHRQVGKAYLDNGRAGEQATTGPIRQRV